MSIARYKLFLFILLAFIGGIGFASFVKIPFFICYVAFLVGLVILFFGWRNEKIRIIGLIFIFIILGAFRYNLSWPKTTPDKIQFYNGQKAEIQGTIINVDKKLDKQEIVLKSEKLQPEAGLRQWADGLPLAEIQENGEKKITGKVLVYGPLYADYQYGDRLQIFCQLNQPKPIAGFSYHEYLAKQDIYSTCFPQEIKKIGQGKRNFLTKFIFQIRDKVKSAIDQNLTEPEGSILSTLLLGVGKETPQEVRNWFALTGTAHILSISGLHVAILASLLVYLAINFLGLARPKAFYFVVLVLIFYVILAGSPAAAIRSAIMGIVVLLAEKIGRRSHGLNLIIFAAFIMLLFNPKLLKSDMGFQLSFCAILGIILFNDYFLRVFGFLKFLPEKLRVIQIYLATTCSAYLFSLPLVLFYFGNLSLIAPIANILILPALPFLMGLGFVFALGSLIYFDLAKILAWPVWLFLKYIVWVVKNLSTVPYFSFNLGKINWWLIIPMYLLLTFWIFIIRKKQKTII